METVTALNVISGQVAEVPLRIFNHPVLGANLELSKSGKPLAYGYPRDVHGDLVDEESETDSTEDDDSFENEIED